MRKAIVWEIKRGWRSFQLPGFLLVLLFFALLDPPMIKYMETIIARFGGGIKMELPPPTAQLAFLQFLQDLAQLGGLVIILLVAGSVAGEKKSGLTCWYLAQPIERGHYLLCRWLTYFLLILAGVMGAGLLSYLYACSLLGVFPLTNALGALAGSVAYLLVLMSSTFLGSVLFSQAGAGVFGFALGYGGYLFLAPAKALGVAHFFPHSLPGACAAIVAGTYPKTELYLGIASSLVLAGVLLWLAVYFFQRMELGCD